jgi:hypothetical protein
MGLARLTLQQWPGQTWQPGQPRQLPPLPYRSECAFNDEWILHNWSAGIPFQFTLTCFYAAPACHPAVQMQHQLDIFDMFDMF